MTSPRTLSALVRMHQDQNRVNGLPCGEYVYTNKCENQEQYRAIEAMRSPEQLAEIKAKKEAEQAARMQAASTLTPEELQLAIDTLDEVRRNTLFYGEKGNELHWDLIPVIAKLRRMQNED